MNARQGVEDQLDKLVQGVRGSLPPGESQLKFDADSRRLRSMHSAEIGRHADQQSNTWMGEVEKTSADLNLSNISRDANDPTKVQQWTNALIDSRVKTAQRQGAVEGDSVYNDAVATAKRDAKTAQVSAMSVNDPKGAMDEATKSKDVLGANYDKLAEHLRTRVDQQVEIGAVNKATVTAGAKNIWSNPGNPIFDQAARAAPGSASPAGLARFVQIESSGNPSAGAEKGSKHQGLVQADTDWWNRFGAGSRLNPHDAIMAAARSTAYSRPILTKVLGRDPSDAELYLAHQQGEGGASKLLANPNARAGDLVGDAAIRNNMGNPDAPASAFTGMWIDKFNKGVSSHAFAGGRTMTMPQTLGTAAPTPMPTFETPSTPAPEPIPTHHEQALSDTLKNLDQMHQNGELSDVQLKGAQTRAVQQNNMQQLIDENTQKQKHEISEKAMSEYMPRIMDAAMGGQQDPKGLLAEIRDDKRLTPQTQHTLWNLTVNPPSAGGEGRLGRGYTKTLANILAEPGDPNKITDPTEIWKKVLKENGEELTPAGAGKLAAMMNANKRSVDDQAVSVAKHSLLQYANSQLSFDQEMRFPGMKPLSDPNGRDIYNSVFVPKFEAAYDSWIKDGKDPWKFLDKKNVDSLMEGLRPKSKMAQDRVAAMNDVVGGGVADKTAAQPLANGNQNRLPVTPAGVDTQTWARTVVDSPPAIPRNEWGAKVSLLAKNPTARNVELFNQAVAKQANFENASADEYNAQKILDKLGIKVKQ